jgi:hypothetical protein
MRVADPIVFSGHRHRPRANRPARRGSSPGRIRGRPVVLAREFPEHRGLDVQLEQLAVAGGEVATERVDALRHWLPRPRPWLGQYRIHYPGTVPVDQYAALTSEGIERGIVRGGGRVLDAYTELDVEIRGRSETKSEGGAFERNKEPARFGATDRS